MEDHLHLKEKREKLLAWFKKTLKNISAVTVAVLCISVGAMGEKLYLNYKEKTVVVETQKVKSPTDVSVWINTKSELMVSNNATGSIILIADSTVLQNIWLLRTNQIYQKR